MSSVQLGWLCMPHVWLHLPIQLRVAGRGVEVYAGVVIHIADSGSRTARVRFFRGLSDAQEPIVLALRVGLGPR